MTDTISTTMLAAWFGYTNAGAIKRLKKAGLTPARRGPRGASEWDRPAALKAMHDTPKHHSFANYDGVVYAEGVRKKTAQKQQPSPLSEGFVFPPHAHQEPPRLRKQAGGVTDFQGVDMPIVHTQADPGKAPDHQAVAWWCMWRACESATPALDGFKLCMKHALEAQRELVDFNDRAIEARGITQANTRRASSDDPEVVYFMLKGDRVKIGFTTNLRQRSYAHRPDEVLGYFAGGRDAERIAHQVFAEWALGNEWFAATPECLAKIASFMSAQPAKAA